MHSSSAVSSCEIQGTPAAAAAKYFHSPCGSNVEGSHPCHDGRPTAAAAKYSNSPCSYSGVDPSYPYHAGGSSVPDIGH
ncbi:hypothetical protein QYF36_021370 [Acer negundo]|nr:hypothetical protein QYF36_021370 [Acer negundo]